jgi:hypothetical protein
MKSLRQRGAATDEMSRIVFLPGVGGDFLMLAAKEGCICAKSAHAPRRATRSPAVEGRVER